MKRLELTLDLLTGLDEIDGQHEELFELGNRLLFPEDGEELGSLEFVDAVQFLREYVLRHFAAEQRAMKRWDYPRRAQHEAAHERFRLALREAIEGSRKGRGTTAQLRARIHGLLADWFAEHIRHQDTALARYLLDHDPPGRRSAQSREAATRAGEVAEQFTEQLRRGGFGGRDPDSP